MKFKDFWKTLNEDNIGEYLIKSGDKLSREEIVKVQEIIRDMQSKGKNASTIIKYLQNFNHKLADKYKAERAFYTELKRLDTHEVRESGANLAMEEFRVLLSPHACPICVKKTNDGKKIFKSSDLKKAGYGHYPPFHPNCYCVLVPV